jgi:hypothetical protein
VNPDWNKIRNIANRIVEAIDDPLANWKIPVINYRHVGHIINQSGSGSIGNVGKIER